MALKLSEKTSEKPNIEISNHDLTTATRLHLLKTVIDHLEQEHMFLDIKPEYKDFKDFESAYYILADMPKFQLKNLHGLLTKAWFGEHEPNVKTHGSISLTDLYPVAQSSLKPIEKGSSLIIPTGSRVIKLHFIPFFGNEADYPLETMAIGLEDLYSMLFQMDFARFAGLGDSEKPTYFIGYTNKTMADIAIKHLHFKEYSLSDKKPDQQSSIYIKDDSPKTPDVHFIAISYEDLKAHMSEIEKEVNRISEILLRRKGQTTTQARALAVWKFLKILHQEEIKELSHNPEKMESLKAELIEKLGFT